MIGKSPSFLLDSFRRCQKVLSNIALGSSEEEVFVQLQDVVESMGEGRIAAINYVDHDAKTLHIAGKNNLPAAFANLVEGLVIGEFVGSCGAACYLGTTVIAADVQTHQNWKPYAELAQQVGLASCWSVPIILSKGEIYGSFAVYSTMAGPPSDDELEVLTMAAHIASVVIDKHQLEERLRFAATHDILTGLLNRTQFEYVAEKALLQSERNVMAMSILFIDLNGFKLINDQYDHNVGDQVLQMMAGVLLTELRESDMVCRRGGDEFIVGLVGTSKTGAKVYIDRVRKRFQEAQQNLVCKERVDFAVGIAEADDGNYPTLNELIIEADKAMYLEKETMKGRQIASDE